MKDNLALSECGQYIVIESQPCQDLKLLQGLLNKARSVSSSFQKKRLMINLEDWLNDTSNMEEMLVIADIFKLFECHSWRIAVVVSRLNQKTVMLENLLDFKGVTLQHFVDSSSASEWLLSY